MNELRNRKERTERKRPLGDISRAATGRSPSSPAVVNPVKRPSRACSSRRRFPNVLDGNAAVVPSPISPLPRTSPKVASDYAFSAERPPSRPSASHSAMRAVSLTLATSLSKELFELRSLWEMAAVNNFFCVFRHMINNLPEFTMDDLEFAILNPNSVLDTIHVVLLKGVPPAARVPLRGDTWPTVLSKKFKDWWWRVAEGPCPLVPCQGAELATYLELDAPTRVRVLLALCEMRVDQDDARLYIDDLMKRSPLPAVVRKDRSGCGAEGMTFWLEEDPLMGQRLYREGQATLPAPPSKNKSRGWGRGRNVPPPVSGNWETVATNFQEFQEVSNRLLESRNRLEAAMGKKLMQNLMPQLEEIQKRKDRMVKKQQREAVLLDNLLQANGLAAGRSRRERKPVTYTFDEFDRSISEAIKFTKTNVSDTSRRHGFANGVKELGGMSREQNGNAMYGQIGYANGGGLAMRRSLRNSRPQSGEEGKAEDVDLKPHRVEADSGFSDDEIEGEAVYDDDYLAARQRKGSYSSGRGESLRGDDGDAADFIGDGEDEEDGKDSDEYGGNLNDGGSDGLDREVRVRNQRRRCLKVRLVNDISCEGECRNVRPVLDRMAGSDVEDSNFNEQIVRDVQQRLWRGEGGRAESSAQGPSQNRRKTLNVRIEGTSDSQETIEHSLERGKGKRWRLVEVNRKSGCESLMEDNVQSIDHSVNQLVQSDEDENSQEPGSVDIDQEDSTGQKVERMEGSGKRRPLLDLNEVATVARGICPLSENGVSKYSEEPKHGAEAG
ncbi:hypothetical protein KC19_VG092200 [Ceratodon purpureus]|uniref:DDT domain-containing protein n=1 Tax=Ceratodon purpureus TaxID=3225 RepID=A0A8T0HNQ9_CERPU|nr:hypothetical protein KC19_VG092200 [Ceratodon purpureus]